MWWDKLKSTDNVWLGAILGLITPIVGTLLVFLVFGVMVQMNYMDDAPLELAGRRTRTLIIIGICINIFWIQLFNRRFTSQTSRGVLLLTMAYCIAWFVFYAPSLYQEF